MTCIWFMKIFITKLSCVLTNDFSKLITAWRWWMCFCVCVCMCRCHVYDTFHILLHLDHILSHFAFLPLSSSFSSYLSTLSRCPEFQCQIIFLRKFATMIMNQIQTKIHKNCSKNRLISVLCWLNNQSKKKRQRWKHCIINKNHLESRRMRKNLK